VLAAVSLRADPTGGGLAPRLTRRDEMGTTPLQPYVGRVEPKRGPLTLCRDRKAGWWRRGGSPHRALSSGHQGLDLR
jgi:hypothetical protein